MAIVTQLQKRSNFSVVSGVKFPISDKKCIVRMNSEASWFHGVYSESEYLLKMIISVFGSGSYEERFMMAFPMSPLWSTWVDMMINASGRAHLNEYSGLFDANANADPVKREARLKEFAEIVHHNLESTIRDFQSAYNTRVKDKTGAAYIDICNAVHRQVNILFPNIPKVPNITKTFTLSDEFVTIMIYGFKKILTYYGAFRNADIYTPYDDYSTFTDEEKADHIFLSPHRLNLEIEAREVREKFLNHKVDKASKTGFWGQFFHTSKNFFTSLFSNFRTSRTNFNLTRFAQLTILNFYYPHLMPESFKTPTFDAVNNFQVLQWALAFIGEVPVFTDTLIDNLTNAVNIHETAAMILSCINEIDEYRTVPVSDLKNFFHVRSSYEHVRGIVNNKFMLPHTGLNEVCVYDRETVYNDTALRLNENLTEMARQVYKDIDLNDENLSSFTKSNFQTNLNSLPAHLKRLAHYSIMGICQTGQIINVEEDLIESLFKRLNEDGNFDMAFYLVKKDKKKTKITDANVLKVIENEFGNYYDPLKAINDEFFKILDSFKKRSGFSIKIDGMHDKTNAYNELNNILTDILSTRKDVDNKILSFIEKAWDYTNFLDSLFVNVEFLIESRIFAIMDEQSIAKALGTAKLSTLPSFPGALLTIDESIKALNDLSISIRDFKMKNRTVIGEKAYNYKKFCSKAGKFIRQMEQMILVEQDLNKKDSYINAVSVFKFEILRDSLFTNYPGSANYKENVDFSLFDGIVDETYVTSTSFASLFVMGETNSFATTNDPTRSIMNNRHDLLRNLYLNMKESEFTELKKLGYSQDSEKLYGLTIEKDANSKLYGVITEEKKLVYFRNLGNVGVDFKKLIPDTFKFYDTVDFEYTDDAGVKINWSYQIPTWGGSLNFSIEKTDTVTIMTNYSRIKQVCEIIYERIITLGLTPRLHDSTLELYKQSRKSVSLEADVVNNLYSMLFNHYSTSKMYSAYIDMVKSDFIAKYKYLSLAVESQNVGLGTVYKNILNNVLINIYGVPSTMVKAFDDYVNVFIFVGAKK